MDILFLDDDEERCTAFLKKNANVVIVHTAMDAILALQEKYYWDYVFLDHDLGGYDDGMTVVEWIVTNRPHIGQMFIHSWNPPAADMMTNTLKNNGYPAFQEPFGKDTPDLVNLFKNPIHSW